MLAPVTEIARWKARHTTRPVLDYCRWSQAVEDTLRVNFDAGITLAFIWPRIMLRVCFGV